VTNVLELWDGRIVSSSRDGTVRIWDPADGREIERLTSHAGSAVGTVQVDDDVLLVVTEGCVRLWNPILGLREIHAEYDCALSHPIRLIQHQEIGRASIACAAGGRRRPVVITTLILRHNAALRRAMSEAGKDPGGVQAVVNEMAMAEVFGLGVPAGIVGPHTGTESELLHFTIDDANGNELMVLPVFISIDALQTAVQNNPQWQQLLALAIGGGALLDSVRDDVTIVIDPWFDDEYQIPAKQLGAWTRTTNPAQQSS
jgi:hypothetical protein